MPFFIVNKFVNNISILLIIDKISDSIYIKPTGQFKKRSFI